MTGVQQAQQRPYLSLLSTLQNDLPYEDEDNSQVSNMPSLRESEETRAVVLMEYPQTDVLLQPMLRAISFKLNAISFKLNAIVCNSYINTVFVFIFSYLQIQFSVDLIHIPSLSLLCITKLRSNGLHACTHQEQDLIFTVST